MNERINDLVGKTAVMMPGVYTIVYESGKKGVEFNEEALNKFAELIVRECIGIVEGMAPGYTDYRNQIEDSLKIDTVAKIKHQFGLLEGPEPEFDK